MQHIENEDIKQEQIVETKFDKNGNHTTNNNFCAEIISNGSATNFFIKTFSSLLYDPYGPYAKRESILDLKLKKVSEKTFNNYIDYLKTKNLKYLSIAQRGFIDDRA